MKAPKLSFCLFSFLLFSIGGALFSTIYSQSSSYTIVDYYYNFLPLNFLLHVFIFFMFFCISWAVLSKLDSIVFKLDFQSSLKENFIPYIPFAFFLVSSLILQYYFDRHDLRLRLKIFLLFIAISFIYLKLDQIRRHLKESTFWDDLWEKFKAIPIKKKSVFLFMVAFLIYNVCAFIIVEKGITFSGDEPYYLLTTHSIFQDKDINVANNYANKDYFHFYSKEQNPKLKLGIYAREGKKGRGELYPINLPGVSFLVLPYYWLSQFFHGKMLTFLIKASISIWAALLGVQLYLFAKEAWKKENVSLLLWFFYSFTSPILFYSIHIYPEVPIAFFSLYIYRKVRSKIPLSLHSIILMGFFISLFPWFGLKYNTILWPLLFVSIYYLLKEHKIRLKVFYFLALPVLSIGLFYFFLYKIYGSFSPIVVYEGVMTPEKLRSFKEVVLSVPLIMRIDTFFDYFLDQRDGLLLYSPIYFFSLLGIIEALKRGKKELFMLLFISLPFLLNYAFFTHRQGYCPQGRILTPISWIGAVFIGYFIVYNSKKLSSAIFWFLSILSVAIASLLLFNPSFLYQPTTHEFTSRAGDFFVWLSNINIFLPNYLPSFIKIDNRSYLPNYFWIMAIVIFIISYILIKKDIRTKFSHPVFFSSLLLPVVFFLWVLFPRTVLYPTRVFHYSPQKALGFYLFPMGKGVVAKKMAEFYLHREHSYKILFSSKKKLEKIRLTFGSETGEYDLNISFFDIPLFKGTTFYEKKEFIFAPTGYYSFKNLYLYELNLDLKKLSSESMLSAPYFFQVFPLKGKTRG